ncbi:DUF2254 domain-containing protein [Alteromonas antoniana]|uniref:DUF2254 domain-containing protein n=1 Tax=Alteromonas antoniana TaxID=2803813 RepID=UPI001C44CA61|nr:DUF2254 domain-containing protein [Alteromonas antoniana]
MNLTSLSDRLKPYWESLSTSYWFIPICMMLASGIICGACLFIVQRATLPDSLLFFVPLVTQSGAMQLLSTLATAIITATSIAFSMTLVALTLASSQFGPRLIRTFMNDRGTQVVLGTLVSTFLFCMISLHHISSIQENQDAISLLCAVSVVLGVIDVVVIIYFIHHVSTSIQADHVIKRCFEELCRDISALLPKPESPASLRAISSELITGAEEQTVIKATREGYIQNINYDVLTTVRTDIVAGIEVLGRSGDHVFPDAEVVIVHSHCPLPDSVQKQFEQYIIIGNSRTPIQDPEFAVGQLVEIALRALSPGINDPFTAITCLDRLTSACILMSRREFPHECVINESTSKWLKRRTFTFEGVVDKSFDQIRQAGKKHVAIGLHILLCLDVLNGQTNGRYHGMLFGHAIATRDLLKTEPLVQKDDAAIDIAFNRLKDPSGAQ